MSLGAIWSHHCSYFRDFTKAFRNFACISTYFAQILRSFARIFGKSKLLGVRLHSGFLHQWANAMQFNKSHRRASNVTKLFSMQTLASQPRSSGWLLQPWGHWQWQQLATAVDSWIFVDSRTQTRAEYKHPVDASMHFKLVTELHPSLVTSRAITIGTYPAESCDYVCFAPLRHYWNSLLRFSFFYSAFLLNDQ